MISIKAMSCLYKSPFPSKWQALLVIKRANRDKGRKNLTLRAYQCRFCGKWHIGREVEGVRK